MQSSDCVLEISNVFYSTSMFPERNSFGKYEPTAILRDVSARVHGGEILAILGSKGSGKRALLDVIGRADGKTRGRISLCGNLLTKKIFKKHGGYVTHQCHLLPSLTVHQTLNYAVWLANLKNRRARVRQIIADLALSQVAKRSVSDLTGPEYRRLMLGVQIAKDPILLLLDEPTWDTDPLNTYLIVSMLWSYVTRRGSIVVLTMETPRSDVLPFVSQVTLLCLGTVVYSGPTRSMLDYFTHIGFPCPELENPLMYYLCLSTVDRRSREKFLESNRQISILVDKFKTEGVVYMKDAITIKESRLGIMNKNMRLGIKPGKFSTVTALYVRYMAATFAFNKSGLGHFAARIMLLPFSTALLSILYSNSSPYQSRIFIQTSGLIFNILTLFYISGITITALLFPSFRMRYYQEKREGLYGGTIFFISYTLLSLPLSLISTIITIGILVPLLNLNFWSWFYISFTLWSSYLAAEQLSIALLIIIECPFTGAITALCVILASLLIASGTMRSFKNLPEWIVAFSNGLPTRYASLVLNKIALDNFEFENLPYNETKNCPDIDKDSCRYPNGKQYLIERFTRDGEINVFNLQLNFLLSLAFSLGLIIFNSILYSLTLPGRLKRKFRD
ncbi:ATP-binding cassette sub-family G member 5 isoform X2 [Leptopilina boulardi]|uniref:ATP-binding cassette sub-family G member 5 isoform X2 n=1 Tax=Leptopilina boulardi TaxID=63433 RepID=UPI0021F587E8|nr:ATP-binding cassette sub-family G member 5 isoform X2 [Leptopilina boulardi]